jgi:RHS repeat-associated protein
MIQNAFKYDRSPLFVHLANRFTSKERDSETGLDFFGARYFSSAQGRFTSADEPLVDQCARDPQSWNLYSYGRNNPLRYTDPTGQACVVGSNAKKATTTAVASRGSWLFCSERDRLAHIAVSKGNLNPGIGTKNLFGDISYARARDGARVFFRKAGILSKFWERQARTTSSR